MIANFMSFFSGLLGIGVMSFIIILDIFFISGSVGCILMIIWNDIFAEKLNLPTITLLRASYLPASILITSLIIFIIYIIKISSMNTGSPELSSELGVYAIVIPLISVCILLFFLFGCLFGYILMKLGN